MTELFSPVIPEGMQSFYDDYQFAPAIRAGNLLIISGQLGFNENGTLPDNAMEQMENAFGAVGLILASAQMGFENVISIDSFHVGDCHEAFEQMIGVKAKFIPPPHPAWTAVSVAGFALPEAKVELKITAIDS